VFDRNQNLNNPAFNIRAPESLANLRQSDQARPSQSLGGRGAILAAGRYADLAVLDLLEKLAARRVYVGARSSVLTYL
jgi:hypothetical protein